MFIWADQQITLFYLINDWARILPDFLWLIITDFGQTSILLPIWLSFFWYKKIKTLLLNFGLSSLIAIIVAILKYILNFPRPASILNIDSLQIIGTTLYHNSFPSGHTTSAVIFFLLILYNSRNLSARILSFILALLISISRIAVSAHWPQDVLFAWLIVNILISGFFYFVKPDYSQLKNDYNWWPKFILFLIGLLCIFNFFNSNQFSAIICLIVCLYGLFTTKIYNKLKYKN